jgi:hypothetical protein
MDLQSKVLLDFYFLYIPLILTHLLAMDDHLLEDFLHRQLLLNNQQNLFYLHFQIDLQ